MKKTVNTKRHAIVNFLALVGILILINVAATFFEKRIDLTESGRYSLSENTIALLEDDDRLTDRIFFKIYLDGDIPADMKKIRNGIQNILDEFVAVAGDKIQYEFIDPSGSEDKHFNDQVKSNLEEAGVFSTIFKSYDEQSLEETEIWPGAIVEYGGSTVDAITFFNRKEIVMDENLRELVDVTISDLEFKFISSIRRITDKKTKKIGFTQGHGELKGDQTGDVKYHLEKDYLVEEVEINGQLNAFEGFDAIIVAKPTEKYNEKDKFIIDQYIMNGGKVLWFIDPIDLNEDSLFLNGRSIGVAYDLNIEKDLIYKYGARLNTDIVFDENCTHEYIRPDFFSGYGTPWGYYPLLRPENHPITKNLDPIKVEYTSSVTPVNLADTTVKKTILLKSSEASKAFLAPVDVNYNYLKPQFKHDCSDPEFANNPIAILLEGQFSSPFENRLPTAFLAGNEFETKFKSVPNKMLVVSDGDLLNSTVTSYFKGKKQIPVALDTDPLGVKTKNGTLKFNYGNRDFVLNAVDYLVGDNALIGIRSKTITLRMLDEEKVVKDKSFWKFVNIIFPLLFIGIFAFIQIQLRKRKFTK